MADFICLAQHSFTTPPISNKNIVNVRRMSSPWHGQLEDGGARLGRPERMSDWCGYQDVWDKATKRMILVGPHTQTSVFLLQHVRDRGHWPHLLHAATARVGTWGVLPSTGLQWTSAPTDLLQASEPFTECIWSFTSHVTTGHTTANTRSSW